MLNYLSISSPLDPTDKMNFKKKKLRNKKKNTKSMSKCKVNLKRKAQKLKAYADIPLMCPVSFFFNSSVPVPFPQLPLVGANAILLSYH